jgi:type VI secretion system secreted protein VgrG
MSSLSISQATRPLKVTTPLGDALVAVSLTGEEEVSQPFLFVVDFVSTNASVSPGSLLGKAMTLHIPLTGDKSRPIHGLVRRFSSVGRDQSDELAVSRRDRGALFMSLPSDCRTFGTCRRSTSSRRYARRRV